jgi:hypothetical protein
MNIETQMNRRRDFIDVLPACPLRAYGANLYFAVIQANGVADKNHKILL